MAGNLVKLIVIEGPRGSGRTEMAMDRALSDRYAGFNTNIYWMYPLASHAAEALRRYLKGRGEQLIHTRGMQFVSSEALCQSEDHCYDACLLFIFDDSEMMRPGSVQEALKRIRESAERTGQRKDVIIICERFEV